MTTAQRQHPTYDQLAEFLLGRLAPELQTGIESHVRGCTLCCKALRLIPDDSLLNRLQAANTSLDKPSTRMLPNNAGVWDKESDVPPELVEHAKYRIVRVLGRGGMGIVYQAVHRIMDRPVALKVISQALIGHAAAVERFRLEVKAAARLSHPNIVAAHDADQAGDLHFLVMEYVEGVSLARLIEKRGPLPVAHACHYARQVALGLQHAAEHGMVHRDIKPQNLMLTHKGQIKILDFGLARFARAPGPKEPSAAITMTGALLGTPDYMAPEQALDASTADIRADIYSLGCTLYCLLTGREPFPIGSVLEKVESHRVQTPEPLDGSRPDVPAKLVAVVQKMMAKDPADRYQTPAEVAQALAPFTKPNPVGEPKPGGSGASGPARPTAVLAPTPLPSRPLRLPERRRFVGRRAIVGLVGAALLTALSGLAGWAAFGGFGNGPSQAEQPGDGSALVPRPGRVLMVVPHEKFHYPDYAPLRRVLEEGGLQVAVASSVPGDARPAWNQEKVQSVPTDLVLKDARAEDYDAVVFTGAPKQDPEDPEPIEFAEGGAEAATAKRLIDAMLAAPEKKYVASLCRGTLVLVDANVLEGKKVAGNGNLPMRVRKANIDFGFKDPVVVSGRIITARDARDAEALGRQLLQSLHSPK